MRAKGGGKSYALVHDCASYVLQFPGATAYLFRETYDDLEANIISTFLECIPGRLYKYNNSNHEAKFINGSIVKFRYIRNYQDACKYIGRSMDYIGVDELTRFEEKSIQEILSCLRSPKGFPVVFRGTTNPGSKGHYWVKKRYITATNYGKKESKDPITGSRIAFIPATVYDNSVLVNNDPAYVKRLENLPREKKEAFLHGNWDIFEGMAIECFDENIHVVEPFKIPKHWRKWLSCDNGHNDPFAWYWHTVSPDGTVYIYREYTREPEDPKVIYSKQAEKVVELSTYTELENGQAMEVKENIDYIVIGHDAWQHHPATRTVDTPNGKSILDYYTDGGLDSLAGYIKPITDRRLRLATWLEYLEPFEGGDGKVTSKVKIFSTCKRLIETLPLLVRDEKDPEKVADCEIDHSYDSAGYALISYHAEKSKTLPGEEGAIAKHKNEMARKTRTKRLL